MHSFPSDKLSIEQNGADPSVARSKPLVVMDTSVVLDLWLFRNPALGWLASALTSGSLQWVATAAMLEELGHVRGRNFDARHHAMPELFRPPAHLVATPDPISTLRCQDRSDQMFLDLAFRWRCPLLTRDRHLLCLQRKASRAGLHILTPEQAIQLPTLADTRSPGA